ncbi:hypothetical protein [Paraburkholderia sp. JHI869]|uniref:hypothetical protein n=1 Tax=Paraburkholderia sp. JHI869 TaxID=3112959 RepID=UPI00317397A6
MKVRIDIAQLGLAALDERSARRVLAHLPAELAACAELAGGARWRTLRVNVLHATMRDDDPRRIARALAEALVRSVT